MNFKTIYALTLITTFLGASVFPVSARPIANNLESLSNPQNQNFRNLGNDKSQSGQEQYVVIPKSLTEVNEISQMQLQNYMERRDKATSSMSNMMRSINSVSKSIIGNIK